MFGIKTGAWTEMVLFIVKYCELKRCYKKLQYNSVSINSHNKFGKISVEKTDSKYCSIISELRNTKTNNEKA